MSLSQWTTDQLRTRSQDEFERFRKIGVDGLLAQGRGLYPFGIVQPAYHECGHGLAALALGIGVEQVNIRKSNRGRGNITLEEYPIHVQQALNGDYAEEPPTAALLRDLEAYVVVGQAGRAGSALAITRSTMPTDEKRRLLSRNEEGDIRDRQWVETFARELLYYGGSETSAIDELARWARGRALDLLELNVTVLDAFAGALLEAKQKRLRGEAFQKLASIVGPLQTAMSSVPEHYFDRLMLARRYDENPVG